MRALYELGLTRQKEIQTKMENNDNESEVKILGCIGFEGCGHNLIFENPAKFKSLLMEFFDGRLK